MSEPFIGEIRMFGGNFAPRGWAFCDGQLLDVSQNNALFALLGTIYGGDGRTTFGLPDLRGRAPVQPGNNLRPGEKAGGRASGSAAVAHDVSVARDLSASTTSGGSALRPDDIAPHPTLSIQFIIALAGAFPQRS
jgi:microcystin-dependent protein